MALLLEITTNNTNTNTINQNQSIVIQVSIVQIDQWFQQNFINTILDQTDVEHK